MALFVAQSLFTVLLRLCLCLERILRRRCQDLVFGSRFAGELGVDTAAARITHHVKLLVHSELGRVVCFVGVVSFARSWLARKLLLNLAFRGHSRCFLFSLSSHLWFLARRGLAATAATTAVRGLGGLVLFFGFLVLRVTPV